MAFAPRSVSTTLALGALLVAAMLPTVPLVAEEESGTAALAALDRYMEGWNRRDPSAFVETLHFPHTRQSVGSGKIYYSAESYLPELDFDRLVASGWDHSEWVERQVLHSGREKVHVAGRWARFDAEGRQIHTHQVSYVVSRKEGKWGVEARFAAGPPAEEEKAKAAEEQALEAVRAYMSAFNDRDPAGWAATLNYPHIRVASGQIQSWHTEETYTAFMDFDRFAQATGWHHSAWDDMRAVQVADDAVNVALHFSRYDEEGNKISTFDTLYLVTRQNGHWGVRARSSFAP